ncbi:MAG: hypothetical protein DMF68_21905 [Acidobacteria bacterium]|nr:MAG: hypothetical protein DMF68_21905 [Acidobacteriota bacterium]
MPLQFNQDAAIAYLQQFLTFNKARGMVSECSLETHLKSQHPALAGKYLPGGWVISPKTEESSRYRFVISVMPHLYVNEAELDAAIRSRETDRGFQALATFLTQSAIGVIVAGAFSSGADAGPAQLIWKNYSYIDERLRPNTGTEPFDRWPGTRGRASAGNAWQADVIDRFRLVEAEQLTGLTLRQAYYYGYLKQQLKKPFDDPYDVDAFIVSFRQAVMPVEIKEKSPTPGGAFGLDAGRILMMLRMCLATDSNALYIVREVDNSATRQFVNWRCITLSNLVMGCSWNLQAGGAGMGGGATQTVMMPGSLFEPFTDRNLSEEWLEENSSLQTAVRSKAQELAENLAQFL